MDAEESGPRSVADIAWDGIDTAFGLAHNTAKLAGVEARAVARRLVRRVAILIVALALGAAATSMLLVGLALLILSTGGLPDWAAFGIVGVSALAVAIGAAWYALRRLGDVGLTFPGTRAEIRRDLDAVRRQRGPQ